jgi:hypothetical protein
MVKTSLDPNTVIKGTELLSKLEQVDRDRRQEPQDDGLRWARTCRDYLMQSQGASAFMLIYKAAQKDMGHPGNYPLLHDVHSISKNEVFGPQIWAWASQNLSPEMRQLLDERLSDRKWQLETRKQIWDEIGVDISKVTQAA